MTLPAVHTARPLIAGFAILLIGISVTIVTVLGLTLVRPVLVAFAFGGLVLLIPTVVVRDQRAYWLFLLVLSIPFDVSKRITTWLVEPWILYREYGLPGSGTVSVDVYLTDVVLFAMVLPWLARLCVQSDRLYFPKIGYLFVLYLVWSLIVSLVQAESFYLSIFEWMRELLYFLFFLYIINNVITETQFRAIVLALFVGLAIEAGTVITFFEMGIGTETFALSGLYREQGDRKADKSVGTLYEAHSGAGSHIKRSAGTFAHPAHAAYYFEYILTVVLAYLVAVSRVRDRLLLCALFGTGWVALYLTFSRSGLVSLLCSSVAYLIVARWSGLISRRTFDWCVLIFVISAALISPLLIDFLGSRPESITKRLELNEVALATYWQRPVLGAGLNNSSAVMEGARIMIKSARGSQLEVTVVHNHYLIVLIEVGLIGFLLFFSFFGQVAATAFRHMRAAESETKLLLASIVSALVGIAIHNFGDPFGGHVVQAMLWLYAGLIIAICRRVQTEGLPAAGHGVPGTSVVWRPEPRSTV